MFALSVACVSFALDILFFLLLLLHDVLLKVNTL